MKLIGQFTIDTGLNEPEWADQLSWTYSSKVEAISGTTVPQQPNNTALYNLFCESSVMRGKTFYNSVSTSFPSNIGERRIYLKVAVWIDFIRAETFFSEITVNNFKWQLIRNV